MENLNKLIVTASSIFTFLGVLIFIFIRPLFVFYLGAISTIFLFGFIFLIVAAHNHSLMSNLNDAYKAQMDVQKAAHQATGNMVASNARVQAELMRFAAQNVKNQHQQFHNETNQLPHVFGVPISIEPAGFIENDDEFRSI